MKVGHKYTHTKSPKDDAAIYRYLQKTDPDGMEMLSDEEQAAFEKKYGL